MRKSGQWKVVDAHFLREPALEAFFKASPNNRAVFSEYNCMECYKGNALKNIERSLQIASRFPRQVVILKGAPAIITLQTQRRTTSMDFIDHDQTRHFSQFCDAVRACVNGDVVLREQIEANGRAAEKQLSRIADDSRRFAQAVLLQASHLDPELVRALRRRELPSGGTAAVIKGALDLSVELFAGLPVVKSLPPFHELPDSFVFRYSLMGQLLALRWIADGGIQMVKPNRLGNDLVDMSHAVYATYFDGLLTLEKKWLEIYQDASWFFQVGLKSWATA